MTVKRIIGKAPFKLVYGQDCTLPIYELLQQCTSDQEAFQARIDKLVELDEVRRMAFEKVLLNKKELRELLTKEQEM